MELGTFSVSLAVKDLSVSQAFYEKIGFEVFGGDASQGWLIMKCPSCVIGLFQGMFDKNILTFNPGWDEEAQPLDTFTDVRDLQKALKADRHRVCERGGRDDIWPGEFRDRRSRRQSNPRRPACVTTSVVQWPVAGSQ